MWRAYSIGTMSLTANDQHVVREIVRKETEHLPDIAAVRHIVRAETAHLPDEDRVRTIVREETADMREDIRHLGINVEVIQDDVKTVLELLSSQFDVKSQLSDHESRITLVEADTATIKSVLTSLS